MREIDLGSPDLDPDGDGGGLGGGLDLTGLGASEAEVAQLMDAIGDVDEAEWAEQVAAMTDDELDRLAAEGEGYDRDGFGPGSEFASWMDSLDDGQFGAVRAEAAIFGRDGGELQYLDFARQLDANLAAMNGREHDRQAQDRAERDRRSGPRHRRPSDEVALSNGLARVAAGTYLYGGTPAAALAADPGLDGLLGAGPAATPRDVMDELAYQIRGDRPPPARSRRQPGLPPVSGLARTLGLVSL